MVNDFYEQLIDEKGLTNLVKESEKHKTLDVRIANDDEMPVLDNQNSIKERVNEDIEVISNMRKKIGRGIGLTAYWGFGLGYFYPTFAKKANKVTDDNGMYILAIIPACIMDIAHFGVFRELITNGLNPLCFIPLATHTLSGIYEWYHYEKNKYKETKTKQLENGAK